MAKYKNTYILQKPDLSGPVFSAADAKKMISGYSIKSNLLASESGESGKQVGSLTYGVVKLTDEALNDTTIELTIDGRLLGRESNESADVYNGISARNMRSITSSCMLMHVNPKLTGNVKVVVDSKSNLYIDTFKVNDSMSKRKYRHVPVSYKDYYGNNIMSVFKGVTSNDFYDVPETYRRLFTVANDYKDQYVDVYRCGASTNRDNLYKESLSILAPLKIGKVMPDFFVIFRVNGSVDESKSSLDTLKYLIKNGEQVKFFDFRENSHLGTYIRNVYEQSKNFVGYVYDSREDQNTNIFNGISLDRGVATSAHESTSFSPDIIVVDNPTEEQQAEINELTQTNINEYYTRGYERNRLVAPDIVNFEFMFNDDTDQFTINTYIGLYLTENDIRSDFYITDIDENNHKIIFSDDTEGVERKKFKHEIIHAYISNDDFIRTNSDNEYDKLIDVKNRLGNNVVSLPVKEMDSDMTKYKSYLSFTVHEALNYGEHLRVIMHQRDEIYDAKTTIYEVVLSNNNEYIKKKHHISDDSIVYKEFDYDNGLTENRNIVIHRIAVSLGESKDDIEEYKRAKDNGATEEELNDIYFKYEIDAIYHAFRSFDDAQFEAISVNGGTISIGVFATEETFDGYEFQRITSNVVYNTRNKDKLKDADDTEAKKVTYFGDNIVPLFVADPLESGSVFYDPSDTTGRFISYTPFNYEILGPRQMNVVQFIDINGMDLYELNPLELSEHVLHDQLVAISNNNVVDYEPFVFSYRVFDGSALSYETLNINIIASVYRSSLMMVKNYGDENISYINLYEPYLMSESICGILPIKDFDRSVTHSDEGTKPYDEYDSNFVNLKYIEDTYGLDFDVEFTELNDPLKNWYQEGIRNTIGALTTPSIVKWMAAATEAGPIYYVDGDAPLYLISRTDPEKITVTGEHTYYRWRLFDPDSGTFSASSLLTELGEYTNSPISEQSYAYSKAYCIAAEVYDDDETPHLYDIKSCYKIIATAGYNDLYNRLILTKVSDEYAKRIQSDGSFSENAQSNKKYILSKYRDIEGEEDAMRKQEYNIIHMQKYVGGVTMRDALINGQISIEDIVESNMSNNVIVDSIDDCTLRFMLDGITRTITIEDSTSISLSNYKNFNIYLAKSEYSGNTKDIEIFVDVINKDILLVWYALMDNVEYHGNNDNIVHGDFKFREMPTDYTERDIHIVDDTILLGDEEIDRDTPIILYTDNMQISYQPITGAQDSNIVLYNQYGYNYPDYDDSLGYTTNPTDYDLNRICKDNRVIMYKVTNTNTIDSGADAADIECATFIKETEEGYSDYTNEVDMKISSDSEQITDTYKKMWFSPMLVDWVTFNNTKEDEDANHLNIEGIFTKTQFINIAPKEMEETIPMYYNKVSNVNNYCVYQYSERGLHINETRYRTSIGRNYSYKTLSNCFSRKFNILTNVYSTRRGIYTKIYEKPTYVGGYTTGSLHKTYLNSLALNTRKNDISDILLTIWNGVSVRKGKIYFNITTSLINHIMSMSGYTKSWSYYKDSRYTDMKKFIIDSILPYLTIDNKSELNVYFQKGTRTNGSSTKPPRATKIDNVKREVIKQNGEYYVVLSPDIHKIGTYYITFKVTQ